MRSQERPGRIGVDRGASQGAGKTEKEAHGEFESEHLCSCGAQDAFYVGNLKVSVASTSRPSSIPTPRLPSGQLQG